MCFLSVQTKTHFPPKAEQRQARWISTTRALPKIFVLGMCPDNESLLGWVLMELFSSTYWVGGQDKVVDALSLLCA